MNNCMLESNTQRKNFKISKKRKNIWFLFGFCQPCLPYISRSHGRPTTQFSGRARTVFSKYPLDNLLDQYDISAQYHLHPYLIYG